VKHFLYSTVVIAAVTFPGTGNAGGHSGVGAVSWKIGQAASVSDSGFDLTEYVGTFLDTLLDFGATLTSGRATGGSPAPTPSGAVAGVVPGAAEVVAELAVTDYKVSQNQRRQIEIYGPMIEDGFLTVEEATNYVMGSNYTPGAGRDAVEAALSEYTR